MLFSSIVFLFTFLPAVLMLYYLLPERFHNPVLLLASLIFYAWGEPVYIFLMLLSILFNYFSGLDIARNLTDRRAGKKKPYIQYCGEHGNTWDFSNMKALCWIH